MKAIHRTILVSVTFLLTATCSGDRFVDPTLVNDGYTGITYTDMLPVLEGPTWWPALIGPVDPEDWLLFDSEGNEPLSLHFANVVPAAPNPSHHVFTVTVRASSGLPWSIDIVDENNQLMESRAGITPLGPGWEGVRIGVFDYTAGIYRVYYKVGEFNGFGDIWITPDALSIRDKSRQTIDFEPYALF